MANIFKKKSADDPQITNGDDPVSGVSERLREQLAPVEAKLDEGRGKLICRIDFEYEQAEGLARGLDLTERMQRIDTGNQWRLDGLSVTAEALDEEIIIRSQGANDYMNAGAEMQRELNGLRPEQQAINARIQFLERRINDARTKSMRERTTVSEKTRDRDTYLELLERVKNGENVKLRKVPDRSFPLHRQPVAEANLIDVAGWEDMPLKQAEKLLRVFNEKVRRQSDQEWADLNRARDIGIKADDLKYLQPRNGPGEAA